MDETISKILNNYNIKNAKVSLIRETLYNNVYKIIQRDEEYVLRIGSHINKEDVIFETELLSYLFENKFPCPRVFKTKNEQSFLEIDSKIAVLFSFIKGVHIEVSKNILPTPEQVFQVGKNLALFHNLTNNKFNSSAVKRRTLVTEINRVINNKDKFVLHYENDNTFIPLLEEIINYIKNTNDKIGIVHNDLRYHNIFFNDDNNTIIGIIDYDWSCPGQIIKDVAHTALEWSFPDGNEAPNMDLFNACIEGYNSLAEIKVSINNTLYYWVVISAIADASTYFMDRIDINNPIKKKLSSYMYQKALYFNKKINEK